MNIWQNIAEDCQCFQFSSSLPVNQTHTKRKMREGETKIIFTFLNAKSESGKVTLIFMSLKSCTVNYDHGKHADKEARPGQFEQSTEAVAERVVFASPFYESSQN
jgi:hypothetical protein